MTPMVITACDVFEHEFLQWSGAPTSYLSALALVGCLPVQLPTLEAELDPSPLLDVASGVLITGARSNVHPTLYGAEPSKLAEPYDRARDRSSLRLIREALARGLPLLAICRGIQELNVALGGTLHPAVASVPGRFDHHARPADDPDGWFGLRHEVTLSPTGLLARVLGSGPVRVNSVHYQGIDRLAHGLVVNAVAPDGTIEAVQVEGARSFALGVQWHPEYFVARDTPSRAIFEAFAAACRGVAADRRLSRAA